MATDANVSLLEKKQSDNTNGDALKVEVVSAIVLVTTPILVKGIFAGASKGWNKIQSTRAARKATETPKAQ